MSQVGENSDKRILLDRHRLDTVSSAQASRRSVLIVSFIQLLDMDLRAHIARRDPDLEHAIDLLERMALQLGHVQDRPPRQSAKDEPDFALEVRLVRIDHVRDGKVHDQSHDTLDRGGTRGCRGSKRWR